MKYPSKTTANISAKSITKITIPINGNTNHTNGREMRFAANAVKRIFFDSFIADKTANPAINSSIVVRINAMIKRFTFLSVKKGVISLIVEE